MRKYILILFLLCLHGLARGQTSDYIGFYWFDNQQGTPTILPMVEGRFDIDASSLADGLHAFHYVVAKKDGGISQPSTSFFVKMPTSNTTVKGYYWFDNEAAAHEATTLNGMFEVDASMLSDGFHQFSYIATQYNGGLAKPASCYFLKIAQVAENDSLTCICSVDGQLRHIEKLSQQGGVIHWNLDMQDLANGIHQIQLQAVTKSGALSSSFSSYFMRVTSQEDLNEMRCVYAIDNDSFHSNSNVVSSNGSYHYDLDLSGLDDGLHYITFLLHNDRGTSTKVQTRFFVKVPLGGNGITQYQYWLNDDDINDSKTVALQQKVSPLQLMSLLPVESRPFRSSLFQFDANNGKPMVYAMNTIHLRFYDAAMRFTDVVKDYTDYSVSQEVNVIKEIESGVRETTEWPKENEIRWYQVTAERGDSLRFKLDHAATLQLFAPSGKEVYNVSGAESVKWGGLHAAETGTFYLALHDVTATQGDGISLDYEHIDKYAVLRQDVAVVGNGGCSTITFEGNGFNDLYAVDLYNGNGSSFRSVAICHENNASVSVTFDFTEESIGNYDAMFHFTEEDKLFSNILTVEKAKEIELTLNVKYPSSFLRGTSTTYAISVTNNGNVTAYDIPMEIYLSSEDTFKNIQSIIFKDEYGKVFNNFSMDLIDKDSIDNETLTDIEELMKELNGLQSFIVNKDSISGEEYGFSDMMLTIPSESTNLFYIEIMSSAPVNLYVRIPSTWLTISSKIKPSESKITRSNVFDRDWCCEKEKWQCTSGVINNIVGLFPIAGCISGGVDYLFVNDVFEIACTDGADIGDKIYNFYLSVALDKEKNKSHLTRGLFSLVGCASGAIGKAIAALKKKLNIAKNARAAALAATSEALAKRNAQEQAANVLMGKADDAFKSGNYHSYELFMEDYDNCIKEVKEYQKIADEQYAEWKRIGELITEYEDEMSSLPIALGKILTTIKNGLDVFKLIKEVTGIPKCMQIWKKTNKECPKEFKDGGGTSTPVVSIDPNDIYGYLSDSGSKSIKNNQTDLYYRIEFENDPEFATAAAHTIVVTDTLDATKFDLSTFAPTRVKIGEKSTELTGDKIYVTTIDMRPEINAIAQVEGKYDENKGIAKWHITSLDPMTMEPTDDVMQGVLPVNYDGNGIGEVMFDISLKPDLPHGTEVNNRAAIVFDTNDVIMTPTWTNTIDRIAPTSCVTDVNMLNDSTASVSIEASDDLSGPWRYDVYVQYGEGSAWFLGAKDVPIDKEANVKIYEGINHGFYVVVTDSAGNMEQKQAGCEFVFEAFGSQTETNTKVQLAQGWNWMSHNQNSSLLVEAVKPKAQHIISQTAELRKDSQQNWTGNLERLLPTQMYKVQMAEASELTLSGLLFNATFRPVPLRKGWNWIGYPAANAMSISEALSKLDAEEGDAIMSQDGIALFCDGNWTGTLTTMTPGVGYMYRSVSDKNLFLNASAQASARKIKTTPKREEIVWTADKRKYRNVMGVVARLYKDELLVNSDDWIVGAFCNDECRGIAQNVDGHLMMNVYGEDGETITFKAMSTENGELLSTVESESMHSDLIGNLHHPYDLHIGIYTGIVSTYNSTTTNIDYIYDMQGRKVDNSQMRKGIYVVKQQQNQIQKVIK